MSKTVGQSAFHNDLRRQIWHGQGVGNGHHGGTQTGEALHLVQKRNPARRRIRMGQRMASGPKGAEGSNARMYSADMAIRESIELAQPSEPCSSAIGSATPILTHRCLCSRTLEKCKMSNRRDRSPCPRLTPPSLLQNPMLVSINRVFRCWTQMHVPSSFFSSAAGAASSVAAGAPPAAGAAAAAPPPEPTFKSRSLTSLPSSAFAKSWHQIGSTSTTLAAEIRDWSLSA